MLRRLLIALCLLAVVFVGFWLYSKRARPAARAEQNNRAPPDPAPPKSATSPSAPSAENVPDFRVALDEARSLRDPRLHSREFGRLLGRWFERDPEAVLAYLRQLPVTSDDYTQGVLLVLQAIGERDPERSLALAQDLAVTREQKAIYSSLFARYAQENIQTSVGRLARVAPGEGRENAIRAVVDVWVRSDLGGALAWTQALVDPADRTTALEVVLTEMGMNDPLQAIDLAQKSLTGPALERIVFNALQKLTGSDPQAASGLVKLLPPGELQTLTAVDVARALAAQDAPGALAWAKTLPTEAVRRLATQRVLERWVTTDPAAASDYVASLSRGSEQQDSAVTVASALAAVNPQKAVAWVQSLPASATSPAALAAIADRWAQRDPAAATRWVAEQLPETLSTLAPETLNAALSYWVLQDASAAQEFVRSLPAAAQVGAAEFVSPLLSQNNPSGALAWANSLPNPRARESAVIAAYSRWRDNDPAAAQVWLTTANLSPEITARLQTKR